MDKDLLKEKINTLRESNLSNQEIFDALEKEYSNKRNLALIITSTPTSEKKYRYNSLNNFLVTISIIAICCKLFFSLLYSTTNFFVWFTLISFAILGFLLIKKIGEFDGYYYRHLAAFIIVQFVLSFSIWLNYPKHAIIIEVILILSVFTLAILLDYKIFPEYKPDELRKNAKNSYTLK